MTEEIFDVVNERDEVIGQAPRREVHARGLRHRAVHVLVFNDRGEVFLQKRSQLKDTAKGKWDSSSSGHLETGEAYDACAVRELREEIGLTVASRRGGYSSSTRARKPAGSSAGFTAARAKGRLRCIRRKSRPAGGLRRRR